MIAGYKVRTEQRVVVEGAICGLLEIALGDKNEVYGSIVGGNVEIGEQCIIHKDVLAKRLKLSADVKVKGHIICQMMLGKDERPVLSVPRVEVEGILLCDQEIQLAPETRVSGIISTGIVQVMPRSFAKVILAEEVNLGEESYISYIQCKRLTMSRGAKAAFAYVKEWADLGDDVEVGFLYCDGRIGAIGKGAKFWNSTLVSWHQHPAIREHFFIGNRRCSKADVLGITPQGLVVDKCDNVSGALYTSWLDRDLLRIIGELTGKKLFISGGGR